MKKHEEAVRLDAGGLGPLPRISDESQPSPSSSDTHSDDTNGETDGGLATVWTSRPVQTPQELKAMDTWRQTRLELEYEIVCMEAVVRLSRHKLQAHMERKSLVGLTSVDAKPVFAGRKRGRDEEMDRMVGRLCQRVQDNITSVYASLGINESQEYSIEPLVNYDAAGRYVPGSEEGTEASASPVVAGSISPVAAGSTSPVVAERILSVVAESTSPVVGAGVLS